MTSVRWYRRTVNTFGTLCTEWRRYAHIRLFQKLHDDFSQNVALGGGGKMKDVEFNFGAFRSDTSICLHKSEDLERERERERESNVYRSMGLKHRATLLSLSENYKHYFMKG